MRTYVRMIACVYLPRFELVVAAGEGDRGRLGQQTLAGLALAVAPLPSERSAAGGRSGAGSVGPAARLGEVSQVAEAYGVRRGMALGEALARCPDLVLVPADPVGVAEAWEGALGALEAIGAAVESPRPGLAYFEVGTLRAIHGTPAATLAAAARALEGRARVGAAPTRFCALAAALAVRSRRPLVLEGEHARRWLAGQPVELLGIARRPRSWCRRSRAWACARSASCAKLGRAALSRPLRGGGRARASAASGEDTPLRARCRAGATGGVDGGAARRAPGSALARVLGVLVDRLLARSERRGRTLRAVMLAAQLIAGGGWREQVVFRQALATPSASGWPCRCACCVARARQRCCG